MTDLVIESMRPDDWPAVRAIYLDGIATGLATFETEAPSWEQWDQGHLAVCRLVARLSGQVAGWVSVSPVSVRRVYSGVVDESIYVGSAYRGQGVGRALLEALAEESERHGIWSLQAGIILDNAPSIGLHLTCGFRPIGYQEKKGHWNSVWHDVLLMERRSRVVNWP